MRIILTLPSIAAVAIAIDIRFYRTGNCIDSVWSSCTRFNPYDCCWCQTPALWEAVRFVHIPQDWRVMTTSFGYPSTDDEQICRKEWMLYNTPSNGADSVCHGQVDGLNIGYGSGRYSMIGADMTMEDIHEALEKPCQRARKTDTLFVSTGEKYAISDMEDHLLEQLVGFLSYNKYLGM